MITQIYSIQTVDEAKACLDAGVDFIGLAAGTNADLPAEISLEAGLEIFRFIGNRAGKVALTVADDPETIYRLAGALKPDAVQVCGNNYSATPSFCEEIKKRYPGIMVIQAVGITGPEVIGPALELSDFCDRLILDSVAPGINGIGAAGVVNDWKVCKKIVEGAKCPVILAGGIGPHNVAQAIREVRPWGVDSLTKTNKDGKMEKDPVKLALFVKHAMEAARELGL
jgi:phosphoribosylanthranilate isomerase